MIRSTTQDNSDSITVYPTSPSQKPTFIESNQLEAGPTPPVTELKHLNTIQEQPRKLRGVAKVEAAQGVWGKYSKYWLYLGLALASYIYSLDGSTTWFYLSYAQSSFEQHSLISTVQTVQGIMIAVGKPPMAKLADVLGRAEAYMIVVLFYGLGYIVIATAQGTGALTAGIILIIIADITTLRYRGMVSALISAPFLINGFIASNIYSTVYDNLGWRWGYGMFAILVPVALSPLIVTLSWAQRKAVKMGLIDAPGEEEVVVSARRPAAVALFKVKRFAEDLDIVGLLLLSGGWCCLLVPITLASSSQPDQFRSSNMIAMLVIGPILLALFMVWELKFAKEPVVAWRFFVGAALIGFFDFVAFYISYLYLYSFIVVTKPWSLVNIGYFSICISAALTFFAIVAGIIMAYTRRWKLIRDPSDVAAFELVFNQILQGWGGGFASVVVQVAAQGSVSHTDVAVVTAVVLLITEMGTSIGNTIAGGVWSNQMPGYLLDYLPATVNTTERASIFGSITVITSYPINDPIRVGAIQAYEKVMLHLTIAATVVAVIPLLLGIFLMKEFVLSDKQNNVDKTDLVGRARNVVGLEEEEEGEEDRKKGSSEVA